MARVGMIRGYIDGVGGDATGVVKFSCCQPEAVSSENVPVANKLPVLDQRFPTWVPVLVAAL